MKIKHDSSELATEGTKPQVWRSKTEKRTNLITYTFHITSVYYRD